MSVKLTGQTFSSPPIIEWRWHENPHPVHPSGRYVGRRWTEHHRASGRRRGFRPAASTSAPNSGFDPNEVEQTWKKIETEADAPVRPVICLMGLVGWYDE